MREKNAGIRRERAGVAGVSAGKECRIHGGGVGAVREGVRVRPCSDAHRPTMRRYVDVRGAGMAL